MGGNMKLKNILPLSFIGILVLMVVFYAFKDKKKSVSYNENSYEYSFEDESYKENIYKQKDLSKIPNSIKRNRVKKLNSYKSSLKKRRVSNPFKEAHVRETPENDSSETQNTAQNEKNSEDDEEKDEEKKDQDEKGIASDESSYKENKDSSDPKEIKSVKRTDDSYYRNSFFVSNASNFNSAQQEETEEEGANGQNDQAGNNEEGSGSDGTSEGSGNGRFSDVDLDQLPILIEEENFDEVLVLVNSSSRSAFRREALRILVTSANESEERNRAISSVITNSYFNTQQLSLFTQSMIEDEYTVEQRSYMGSLIIDNLDVAPTIITQEEYVDLYFNGVRAVLPTPGSIIDPELAELYLTIDFNIEKNFAIYENSSEVAVSQ